MWSVCAGFVKLPASTTRTKAFIVSNLSIPHSPSVIVWVIQTVLIRLASFLAFRSLTAILQAAHCTFDDVLDATVFIVDPESRFEQIWNVVQQYWGDAPHPTVTAVGVTWLYGLQFEIKVIARIPD
jgi:hypothetical protein